jgi:hypothetical protein
MTEHGEQPNPRNLVATAILDIRNAGIAQLAAELRDFNLSQVGFLRKAHLHLVQNLQPVYSVNELQPASLTLQSRQGLMQPAYSGP